MDGNFFLIWFLPLFLKKLRVIWKIHLKHYKIVSLFNCVKYIYKRYVEFINYLNIFIFVQSQKNLQFFPNISINKNAVHLYAWMYKAS